MSDLSSPSARFERSFEIYGVHIALGASERELLDRLVALLPAAVEPCDPETVERRFSVSTMREDVWTYNSGNGRSAMFTDLTLVISMLDTELRNYVASNAPDRVFLHAGAVAHRGRAIVIPGGSFSGKSMLVAALVRAGAVYYSDEFAILDERGLVHPYARPLAIRRPDPQPDARPTVESLGGTAGAEPVPVGLIAATRYRPAGSFRPERRSAGHGILALLAHTGTAAERPADTLIAIRRAASTALVLEGERGEADATAEALLEIAEGAFANGARPNP